MPQIPTQPSDLLKARFAVLLDIGRTITGTLKPEELYTTIHRQSARVLRMDGFCITLFDSRTGIGRCVFYARNGVVQPVPKVEGDETIATQPGRPHIYATGMTSPFFCAVEPNIERRTTMLAPLRCENDVLGTISVLSPDGAAYDASELELLEAVADLAAVAIRNAHIVTEVERSRMEAERLEEIGLALSSTLELSRVLERVTRAARDLTNADSATVWLLRGGETVQVAFSVGDIAPKPGTILPVPVELYERMRMRRQPMVFDSASRDTLPEFFRAVTPNRSSMAVPLITDDELIGALSVAHVTQRIYTADEVRLLERLGFQASVAVANARLHEEVRALSLTDPLTGLPNRRQLDLFLEKEFAAARRGRKVAVLMFDLDNFKTYNDAAGHEAGDGALRAFAAVLASQTRAMNLAARFGGDEFVTVLTDSDRRGAVAHAQRVARSVLSDPLLGRIGLRASIGIASFLQRMVTPADLLRAADVDMYRRKTGRAKAIWA